MKWIKIFLVSVLSLNCFKLEINVPCSYFQNDNNQVNNNDDTVPMFTE